MQKTSSVNPNLLSLKCIVFLFFGGVGSLFPFFPLNMNNLGLSKDEAVLITAVAALLATLGPLIVAPLTDRISSGNRCKNGKHIKYSLAICMILSVLAYWLLSTVPRIKRGPLKVSFMCNETGGFVLQERCDKEIGCYDWNSETRGTILVKNCEYTCDVTPTWRKQTETETPSFSENTSSGQYIDEAIYEETEYNPPPESDILPADITTTEINQGIEPIPHMCYKNGESDSEICEVYTDSTENIAFEFSLSPDENANANNSYCKYPIASEFSCRIPGGNVTTCETPVIGCEIQWPYNNTNSLLRKSQCGYDNLNFYFYITIRSFGDIFVTAALVLINAAIVIATRETSTGRGDVGKQLAAGALGLAIFPPLIGWLGNGNYNVSMITFSVLMLLGAFILIFDEEMPLSPPEWWWHTRCGMLALPMSSVRKNEFEIIALGIIFLTLGIFWNSIDAFLPWHIVKLDHPSSLLIGLTYAIAAIPAIAYLIFAEKIVDYCGHSNILILCFISYTVHHLVLISIKEASVVLAGEILELITLHLMWITAILYLRHLVPRKYTTCGQALPVITHFCLGRFVGAFLGGTAYTEYPDHFKKVHKWFASSALIISLIYFCAYHFYLKFYCLPPTQLPPDPAPSTVQHINGNGNYTPLRVYHNSSAKKGHFRY